MGFAALSPPYAVYIDADACPVKQEIYRVAERHAVRDSLAFPGCGAAR